MTLPCVRQLAKIDDEIVEVTNVTDGAHSYLPCIDVPGADYYIAESSEDAGKASRKYWQDMIDNDPKEFTCLIGEERLLQWALGQSDSFGITGAEDFLDTVADHPEEDWASYDGTERDAAVNVHVIQELGIGWSPDHATLDESALRSALADGEHEGCIPDEHAEKTPDEILALAGEDTEEWAADLLNSYRFVECVAYRHN